MSAVSADNDAGSEGGIAAVGLGMQAHVAVLSLNTGQASADEIGTSDLRLLGKRLVPADAVDRDGARLVAAEGNFTAPGRVDEGAGDAVDYRVFADLRLAQGAGADEAGAVGGNADAAVLFEQPDAEAGAGEVAGRARTSGTGADDGDITVELHLGRIIEVPGVRC